jgi:adenine-specific DNA-methyltransferase
MTNLNGQTLDILQENIKNLRQLFPEIACEDKIDFDKLKQILGEYVDDNKERYNFSWNGKGKALRLSQTPSLGTLRPCPEESKNWDTTENLYIEGDNLEVLKLLQKSYHNKVKMIYIDPPYNTGGDFVYPDDFSDSIENYKRITGQIDNDGNRIGTNTEASGRYHTNWLNTMYPRLRLARNLLRDDGIIFISIHDIEFCNLKKICDEIFGEEHHLGNIIWKARVKPVNIGEAKYRPQKEIEYVIAYEKTSIGDKFYPLITGSVRSYPYTLDGRKYRLATILKSNRGTNYRSTMSFEANGYTPPEGQRWQAGSSEIKSLLDNGYIEFKDGTPFRRYFEDEEGAEHDPFYCFMENEWSSTSEAGKTELNNILGEFHGFDTVKPTTLIRTLIMSCTKDNDIVLDFFAGSSTLAESVMKMNADDNKNRKYILVQLPELCNEQNKIDGTPVTNICEIGKERIRRAGDKINAEFENADKQLVLGEEEKKPIDIGFKVFKLDTSNIRKWQPDYDNIEQTLMDSISNFVDGRSELDVVYEIVLKMGLNLTYPIEETVIGGKKVYSVGFGALMMCLDDEITTEVANGMVQLHTELQPETWKVVFKDNGFKSDSNKTNIKEILKCAGLEEDAFTTV